MVCACDRIGGLAVFMHQAFPENNFEHIAERALAGGADAALAAYVVGSVILLHAIALWCAWRWGPQFAARMFPPKGGRVAFSRTALHQVPNAILGVLRNVIA